MPAFRRVWRRVHSRAQAAAARSKQERMQQTPSLHCATRNAHCSSNEVKSSQRPSARLLRDVIRGTSRLLPILLTSGVGVTARTRIFFDRPAHREWLVTKTPLRRCRCCCCGFATTESWFKTRMEVPLSDCDCNCNKKVQCGGGAGVPVVVALEWWVWR
jgi:hypothetical protein